MKFIFPDKPYTQITGSTKALRSLWIYWVATGVTTVSVLLGIMDIVLRWRALPPYIPLWFSKPWGAERLAPVSYIFVPILSAIVIYAVNLILASRLLSHYPMFSRILLLNATLVSLLTLVIIFKIIGLVA